MKQTMYPVALSFACAVLCGCATLQEFDMDSTGTAGGDTPVTMLALSPNPQLSPDAVTDTGPDTPDVVRIRQFAQTFARNFSAEFPRRLEALGVKSHGPGPGVPLLRTTVTAYRWACPKPGTGGSCQVEVRIDGSLLDSNGIKVWTFSGWEKPDEMDAANYNEYYKGLLGLMLKDHVVAAR